MQGAGAFSVWDQFVFILTLVRAVSFLTGQVLRAGLHPVIVRKDTEDPLYLCLWFAWGFFVFGYRRQWSGMCSKIFFSKKYLFIQLCWARHAGSLISVVICKGLPRGSAVKNLPAVQDVQETRVRSLGREDPLEEGMATHPTILLWRVPWTEEPGGLQSIGLQSQTRLKRLCMHACDLQTLSCGMWDLVPWSGIKP